MPTHLSKFFIVGCALFTALALPTLGHAQKAAPLVIQGGTLIDATGRAPIEDAVIVVDGERIKTVGKRGEVAVRTSEKFAARASGRRARAWSGRRRLGRYAASAAI